jgi:two-component system, chemotaxis family, CheB/CheR fusion protein
MNFLRRRFILIADDNRDLAFGLSLLLNLVGFDVETVHDGHAAVTAAKKRRPDILLLDIGLPGLNGHQVARVLRSDDRLKDILIIAISGYDPDMRPGRSKPGDFDHHLVKPVDVTTLLPLINETRHK